MTPINEPPPEEPIYFKPIILEDMPTECDTCFHEGPFDPITKIMKTKQGERKLVIGYDCPYCGTSHLYQ